MKIEPPEVLVNVYRDLRDRRLLSIAIILIVAIVAVPFLLGGGDSSSPAVPSQAGVPAPLDGVEELDPVVLADVPGLRDFHERLDQYQSSNPFKQQLAGGAQNEPGGGAQGGSGGGLPTQSTAPTDPATTDTTGSPDTGAPAPTQPADEASDPGTPPSEPTDPGNSGSDSPSDDDAGASELITYRLDVRVGPVGNTRIEKNVEALAFLPDAKHPLIQYVETDVDGTAATFVVNPEAAAQEGDGKCVRSRAKCEYLLLERGQEMFFLFDDQRYRLELKAINEHREPYSPKDEADDGTSVRSFVEMVTGG